MARGGKREGAGRPPVVDDPAELLAVALRCERIQEESKIDRDRLLPVHAAENEEDKKKEEKDLRKILAAVARKPVSAELLDILADDLGLMMIGRDEGGPQKGALISEESRQIRRAIIEAADSGDPAEGSDEFCDAVEALRFVRATLDGGGGMIDADGDEVKPLGRFFKYAPARPKKRADICAEVAAYFTDEWGREIKPSWVDDCWKQYRASIATDDGWLE